MKFVHIADVHIGMVATIPTEKKQERKSLIWDVLNQVFFYIQKEQVDFLLISGDLFHRQPLLMELKDFNYLCEKVPKTKVVFIAGNHDYLKPESNYLKFQFAKNVSFLKKETLESLYFPEYKTHIYGFSYWQKEIKEPRYDTIFPKKEEGIHILLGHGGDTKHIPMSEKTWRETTFDYVALGHIHQGGQIIRDKVVMAGALLPTDATEVGPHGFWCGEINDGRTKLQFRSIKKVEYKNIEVDITSNMSQLAVKEAVGKALEEQREYELYKIFLKGKKNHLLDLNEVYNDISQYEKVISIEDTLEFDYDLNALKEEYKDQLLGKYIEAFFELPQNETTRYALLEGVDAIFRSMEHK